VDTLAPLLILLVLAAVVWVVSGPLRAGTRADERDAARIADLEAARDAKYREIRDAEMDFRTGKLSEQDYRSADRTLRAEAIEILKELDQLAETSQR
jgi:hypothetical protein